MSRERVKHFSVETMGYLSVLERRLPGTELDYGQIGYYDNCPLSEYLILLNNAEFSKAAESVYLCGINLTIEKLKTMLKENRFNCFVPGFFYLDNKSKQKSEKI